MNKYRVSLCFIQWDDYIIEAENEESAHDAACALYENGDQSLSSQGKLNRVMEYDEVRIEEDGR